MKTPPLSDRTNWLLTTQGKPALFGTTDNADTPQLARSINVYLFSPGGQRAPSMGGMSKIVDYTLRDWPRNSRYRLRVIDTYGPSTVHFMPFHFLRALVILIGALVIRRVDMIHINMSERMSVWRKMSIALIGLAFGIPVIVHLHGASFAEYHGKLGAMRRGILNAALRACTKILVLGSYWQDYAVREIGIPQDMVRILLNAVPEPNCAIQDRSEACRILFIGAVVQRKGVDVLLNALANPAVLDKNWTAVIAGNGNLEHYRAMARQLNIVDRIEFPGTLNENEVHKALSAADIFVLPSRNEGLPLAILEAMSFGCPIVTTAVGSIRDAVNHEENGLLVKVGDSDDLAVALSRLVSSTDFRRKLGQGARAKYEANFSMPLYVSSLQSAYDDALGMTAASAA